MKKILFAVSLIVVGLLALSCDNSTPESPQTYYLPHFTGGGESISSRGLIDMGDWEDYGAGTAVMSYAPMMNALIPVEVTASDLANLIHDRYASFSIYGFSCSLYEDSLIITDDFVYIRFYVSGGGRTAGVIDYCLDLQTQRFSYREIVALTLKYNEQYQSPSILAIQLDDIPLEPDGSFSATEGNVPGAQVDAIVDMFGVELDTGEAFLTRTYPRMKSSEGELAVFLDPRETGRMKMTIGDEALKAIKAFMDDPVLDEDERAGMFGHRVFQYLLPEFYKSGSSLAQHDPRNGGADERYDSYEEYRNDTIRGLNNPELIESDTFSPTEDFIVFDYNTMQAATLRTGLSPDNQTEWGQLVDDKDKLAKMGFAAFYPEVFDDGFTIEEFIETHLRKAGVEDDAYIQSYVDGWKNDWK